MEADICLILEGTYPYVSGGVSSWVHRLIQLFPEYKFTLLYIAPKRNTYQEYKYEVPENVKGLHEVYIYEDFLEPHFSPKNWKSKLEKVESAYLLLLENPKEGLKALVEVFEKEKISPYHIFCSYESYQKIVELYRMFQLQVSFLYYFWTLRFIHTPLVHLMIAKIPSAKVYHTISTGYAGFLGSLCAIKTGRPLLLTEHGIYAKEREMEIDRSPWILDEQELQIRGRTFFRNWWIQFFKNLSRITYTFSEKIITLYEGNQRLQIQDGAPKEKLKIIPNGINLEAYGKFSPKKFSPQETFGIALIGRVVPIKDIKTFIQAIRILKTYSIKFQAYIIGPYDEDPEYYQECRMMVKILNLQKEILFTGRQNILEYFPKIHLSVLTSISEAQPLVVLETGAAGIPSIVTDVGACREMVEGRTFEDNALGPSGIVTSIANPGEIAKAIYYLYSHPQVYQRMAKAAQKRVFQFYNEEGFRKEYLEIYQKYLSNDLKIDKKRFH
ncbi:MAG: DUF3492 domain-containing protein [Planctomycetota bacterium]|nr:MAG: DUF3492 domain-containing protein [Planctomycetota bacterium]